MEARFDACIAQIEARIAELEKRPNKSSSNSSKIRPAIELSDALIAMKQARDQALVEEKSQVDKQKHGELEARFD